MTAAVVLGAVAGLGCLGVLRGLRVVPPTLESIAGTMHRPLEHRGQDATAGITTRIGRAAVARAQASGADRHPRWPALTSALAVTGGSAERLASQILVAAGVALVGPPMLWVLARTAGVSLPVAVPVLVAMASVPVGVCAPVASLVARARDRRRHVRAVTGMFVDLVVLGLAGGVGVEGAMFAASQISPDWAARRLARVLLTARDGGTSPWAALGELGSEIGVPELVELSTTLQLAGTEGSRIRQSLTARAVSLRRHEQADEESAANAMTERLFLPGALLLVGFLLFVGYPAFSRILGGFS